MQTALKGTQHSDSGSQPRAMPGSYVGTITDCDATTGACVIDRVFSAIPAISLMVKPTIEDQVNFVRVGDSYVIQQILLRKDREQDLTLYSQRNMRVIAPKVSVTALDSMELTASNKISVMAGNIVQNAVSSLIQYSDNLIQQVNQFTATARGLMRLGGKQQIITAENDVKIDGERINMG